MDEATILSGIARLEKLATAYGPQVMSAVQSVADTLSGPGPIADGSTGGNAPVTSHLGQRLASVASVLEGLFGSIEQHTGRAGSAIGARG